MSDFQRPGGSWNGGIRDMFVRLAERQPACSECGPVYADQVDESTGEPFRARVPCWHQERDLAWQEIVDDRKERHTYWTNAFGKLELPDEFRDPQLLYQLDNDPRSRAGVLAGRRYVETFEDWQHEAGKWVNGGRLLAGEGLTLWGDVGTGKSSVAYGIAGALNARHYPVLAMTESRMVNLLFSRDEGEKWRTALLRASLVVLDEVADEALSPPAVSAIFSVLHERETTRRPTILTTNLDPAGAMIDHYYRCLSLGARGMGEDQAAVKIEKILSRLGRRNHTLRFAGKDRRAEQRPTWLDGGADGRAKHRTGPADPGAVRPRQSRHRGPG